MARYRKNSTRRFEGPKKDRVLGTPRQERWRARCWALFCKLCNESGWSKTMGRQFIAEKMGIEERYAIIYDMDEVELITVASIINGEYESVYDATAAGDAPEYSKGGKDVDANVPF